MPQFCQLPQYNQIADITTGVGLTHEIVGIIALIKIYIYIYMMKKGVPA